MITKKHFMAQQVCDNKYRAFSTLIIVIIVGAVCLTTILSLSLISISSSRVTGNFYYSQKAKSLANACVMEGLMLSRNDSSFAGPGSLTIDGLNCDYAVTNLGGENREIKGSANISNVTRRVKVFATVSNPQMTISSWQEVSDF